MFEEKFTDLLQVYKMLVAHDKSLLESNNPDEKDEADPERDPPESEPRTEATLSSSVSFFVSSPLYLQLNLSSSCESWEWIVSHILPLLFDSLQPRSSPAGLTPNTPPTTYNLLL